MTRTADAELIELSERTRYFLRMISDLELLRLNNLVASGLASGISPELAMQPLQHEIERSTVRAMDIEFDTGCSESPVESHVLLHPASPLSRHLRSVYAGISGSGTYYNGMFGHGQSLLDAVRYSSAVDDIEQPDRPPAPISEQVLLCVRLLGMSNVSLMPEAASAVRRHLSGIMLDYPVILHPSILVPNLRSNGSQTEYTSLASALACTPHGGLPRYSHFRSRAQDKEGGIDEALLDRLTAFAKHPCVRLAFDSAAVRIRLAPQTQGVRHRPIRKTKETLLRSLTGSTGQRVEFLGSVMELDELGGQHKGQLVRPFWSNVKADRPMLGLLDAMIAASIAAASGIVHVAASQGSIPDALRAYQPDLDFLNDVRRRSLHLFGSPLGASDITSSFLRGAQRRIFLSRSDCIGQEEIAHNTRNLALGMANAGSRHPPQWLRKNCLRPALDRCGPTATCHEPR